MSKKICFKSFLYCANNGTDYTGLIVNKKAFLLKNSAGIKRVNTDKIVSIKLVNRIFFSDIIISTEFEEYKFINILFFKAKNVEYFLKFYINFDSIEKEFALFNSVTNGRSYVPYSVNLRVLKAIKNSQLFKFAKLPLDNEKKEKCTRYLKLYKEYIKNPEMARKINNDNFIEFELERY